MTERLLRVVDEGRRVATYKLALLLALIPLLRPLIELHWTRDVARWTGMITEEDRLRAHLFGSDRTSIPRNSAKA